MIFDYLSLFGRFGENFKGIVFDTDSTEKTEIKNINDINKGAIHNSVEWHNRLVQRIVDEFPLTKASGFLLRDWGEFVGIPNDTELPDTEYRAKIFSKILSVIGTISIIRSLLPPSGNVVVKEAIDLGCFLDACFFDVPVMKTKIAGAVMTYPTNALYIIFNSSDDINPILMRTIAELKAAGVAVFAGVITDTTLADNLYLDLDYLDKDFLGE
ncbi:MAG: hypothetical protein HS129_05105 [Leptospiraceae bacterium]|nr:hypothetical protein [Leptospiraceae bacterium]